MKETKKKAFNIFESIIEVDTGKATVNLFYLFLIAVGSFVLIILIDIFLHIFGKPTYAGTFGDFFGGVLNPVLTFLTFMGLIITIIIQKKELVETRKELAGSRDALQKQSNSIEIQNFENTFFKLLSLHHEIVDSLEYQSQTRRSCFKEYIRMLELSKINKSVDDKTKDIPANVTYNTNYSNVAYSVEHYHKNLYQIFSFIKHSKVNIDKKQYANFVRSQLSRYELHLLFFHGISKFGYIKFKQLIEKYELLEHLPDDIFLLEESSYLYSLEAYGENEDLKNIWDESMRKEKHGPVRKVLQLNV